MSSENNRGIVLCFLIYIVLCATIVSIIERPWLIVPLGTPMNISAENFPKGSFQTAEDQVMAEYSNITFDAIVPGYCGISGVCYPFKDGSPLIKYFSPGSTQCERIDPILYFTDKEEFTFNVVHHVPLYLAIAGSVFLLFTWVIGICSCCNESCGHCTIYSVIAVMLTFSTSLFLAGGLMFFIFGNDDDSCVKRICGSVSSTFDFGHCELGWSMFVAAGGLLFGYIVAILSCVLAAKTPLSRKETSNQVIEVQPAPRRDGQMITSRA